VFWQTTFSENRHQFAAHINEWVIRQHHSSNISVFLFLFVPSYPALRLKKRIECGYMMNNMVKLRVNIKKGMISLFAFGIVAVVLPFSSIARSGNPLSDAGFLEFKENNAAPDFILKDLEDNPIRLDAFQKKVVLLYFWTTW
jgi:hypothetical protein